MNIKETLPNPAVQVKNCTYGSIIKIGNDYFILSTLVPLNSMDVSVVNLMTGDVKTVSGDERVFTAKKANLDLEF